MNTIDLALRIFDHTQDHTLCLMYKQKYNKKFTFFILKDHNVTGSRAQKGMSLCVVLVRTEKATTFSGQSHALEG